MNLEEKANEMAGLMFSGESFERSFYITGFKRGFKECKSELIEFLQANQKATVKQVLEHLNDMK